MRLNYVLLPTAVSISMDADKAAGDRSSEGGIDPELVRVFSLTNSKENDFKND